VPTVREWWGRIAALSTSLGIIISAFIYAAQPKDAAMRERLLHLAWQVPLIGGGFFILISLFLVPYRKYKERDKQAIKLEEELRAEIDSLGVEHKRKLEAAVQDNTKYLYEEWGSKLSALTAERDRLNTENDNLKRQLERPMLVGFFQDIQIHSWTKPDIEDEDFSPEKVIERPRVWTMFPPEPTGTLVVTTVGFVNDSPTRTTLLNFSLTVKVGDKTFSTMYPYEMPESKGWTPPELEAQDKEREKANLINYLNPPLKPVVRGHGVQGFLTFYLDGFMWQEFTAEEWFFTLTIMDAWGGRHDIVQWGPPLRPSQRS
jgi:hypothetical protein